MVEHQYAADEGIDPCGDQSSGVDSVDCSDVEMKSHTDAVSSSQPECKMAQDGSLVVAKIVSQVLDDSDQLGLAYLHQ